MPICREIIIFSFGHNIHNTYKRVGSINGRSGSINYLYTLYALPALFAAMVFMAASFSLRFGRDIGLTKVILLSAAAGFGVFFFQDLTHVLGRSGAVPILLAATAPALASILIGMTLVFAQEDG